MSLHFDSLASPAPSGYRVGPWEVREPLASGAFATVYAGRRAEPAPCASAAPAGPMDPAAPVDVVLKFLPVGTRSPRQLQRLREVAACEPLLLRGVQQPRLIRTYEIRTVDDPRRPLLDGATVLVLERAESSLDALLRRCPLPAAGPALLAQICEGLHQLHHAGWAHGALRPANVLLMPDRTVRLADFRTPAEPYDAHGYAPTFQTTDYTAPELLRPEAAGTIGQAGPTGPQSSPQSGPQSGGGARSGPRPSPRTDPRRDPLLRAAADVWAFGVLAHLVLTGAFPLPGGTPGTRRDAVARYADGEGELCLSPELPDRWREIVTHCLARTPEERTALDTGALLRRVEEAAGARPSPRLPRRRARKAFGRRHGSRASAAASEGFGRPEDASRLGFTVGWGAAAAAVVAGVLSLALVRDIPTAAAAGYDRCHIGQVCFFSEPDGQGRMCAWNGDARDWHAGTEACGWSRDAAPRSVLNNGFEGRRPGAWYYGQSGFKEPLGCLQPTERRNLEGEVLIRSVKWLPSC